MKVLISADMEGTCGVANINQVLASGRGTLYGMQDSPEYEWARRLMAEEINAAVEGALEGGATEVLVNEGHGGACNLLPETLHVEAKLISGAFKPLGQVQGVDRGVAAVILTGYHASAGTVGGVLAHTFSLTVEGIRLNGQPVGECGVSAAIAGHFDVPVVMVSGDDKINREARELLGSEVIGVIVKEGIRATSAVHLHPEKARAAIKDGARRAVAAAKDIPPYRVRRPVQVELDLSKVTLADMAENVPGIERIGNKTVAFTSSDMLQVCKTFSAILSSQPRLAPVF